MCAAVAFDEIRPCPREMAVPALVRVEPNPSHAVRMRLVSEFPPAKTASAYDGPSVKVMGVIADPQIGAVS